mmetsp:Transcript_47184/g.69900  ORF Transcript_47184/g.69900 Transcript_47184/m.69900 type:complete len:169 (-) Transcript_47184:197-703(-)|eukprot:CAMPEP_0195528008 /NCGR_PEP_ID=MMETSP0794_2-20130614/29974_1 /TAXON_ID=515487 /ORGANISM="Stephanopyxis turris, Strain CCMP 815" /LENGTH=168 /DNA_ID=CAMNT_0040659049 /DNA_START=76 /DNA_END=582 /DNA_ORIENTATION=+
MPSDNSDKPNESGVTVYSSLGGATNLWRKYLRPYLLNSDIDDDAEIHNFEQLREYRNKQLLYGFPVRTTFGILAGAVVGGILFRGRAVGRLAWFGAGMGSGVTYIRVQDAYRTHKFTGSMGPSASAPASNVTPASRVSSANDDGTIDDSEDDSEDEQLHPVHDITPEV